MAYIPPHKRHSRDIERPALVPTSLSPQSKYNENLRPKTTSQRRKDNQGRKIYYGKHSISRWWPVGSMNDDPIPACCRLEPFPCESVERETGKKPLLLVGGQRPSEISEGMEQSAKSPWVYITEKILPHLFSALQCARNEMGSGSIDFRPSFVAKFGKVLFYGGSSICLDAIRKVAADAESDSRSEMQKTFYPDLPQAYLEDVQHLNICKTEICFYSEKEYYHVKVYDDSQPDVIISCKCSVKKDGRGLEIQKIELNQVRHLVVDISCLCKDLDLRLMLCCKRVLTDLDDEGKGAISALIRSAVIDPEARGGLRWPLAKESIGKGFSIVGVWHIQFKSFRGPNLRLKLRKADRFDFRTSTGQVSTDVLLKLNGITRLLKEGMVESGPVVGMLQETLKLIWENFLSCNHPLI